MVECGFGHDELNNMTEAEFVGLLEDRLELERIREEARQAETET